MARIGISGDTYTLDKASFLSDDTNTITPVRRLNNNPFYELLSLNSPPTGWSIVKYSSSTSAFTLEWATRALDGACPCLHASIGLMDGIIMFSSTSEFNAEEKVLLRSLSSGTGGALGTATITPGFGVA